MDPRGLFKRGRQATDFLEGWLRDVDHPLARAMVRDRGIPGKAGAGGWTRRDHRRVLLLGLVAFVAGFAISMMIFTLADSMRPGSGWQNLLTGVGLFFLIGGALAGWKGLKHLKPALKRERAA